MHGACHRLGAGHVDGQSHGPTLAEASREGESIALGPADVDVRQHHVPALSNQVLGDLQTKTLGRPGHERDLAFCTPSLR